MIPPPTVPDFDRRFTAALARLDEAVAARTLTPASRENISRWLGEAGYVAYRGPILALIEAGRFDELDRCFWEVIPFGTGGRRGPMSELGSATMNDRTVAESANGLAVYLARAKGQPGGRAVIACDTRHRSADFARITACTLAAHGLKVFLFHSHRSTPELSFAVRHLQCDVGAMISASHNPPADNGFKAYWSHGAQVLPPHDKGIIECVYQSNEIPQLDYEAALESGQIELVGEELDRAYIAEVVALSLSSGRDIPVLFTPLHGVGETSVYRTLKAAGFTQVKIFERQRAPDGAFPHVPRHFPNPELSSVFEPPLEQARSEHQLLILASDPDADRLGVCARDAAGAYVHLTGNQVGALIADYVLSQRQAAGTLTPRHYVVETLVTTPLIADIARGYGVRAIDDLLVGFKYIAQTIDREGPELFVFGAEESLGYLAGHYARDKDAAVAALYICELAALLAPAGKTVLDRLDELYVQHGYYLEGQRSETCTGPKGKQQIDDLMRAFAERPPTALAELPLVRVRDYKRHEVRRLPENTRAEELPEPSGDMLFFEAQSPDCGVTFAVRPSGTEPKIKFYFFARADVGAASALPAVKTRTQDRLVQFQNALSAWAKDVWTAG